MGISHGSDRVVGISHGSDRVVTYNAKFDGYWHYDSGDMMTLAVEGKDSTCPCFNRNYYLSLNHMA